ncbi:MAG: DNA polymerase I, partial [Candidatus Dadabacteria bacterium]
ADYIERYFARYPGVRRFYADTLAAARRDGYVSTLLGRRRYLPDLASENGGKRQAAERMATNTPIQGSAADIIKLAMVRLDELLGKARLDAHMVLQIHDELLLEVASSDADRVASMLRDAMEGAVELAVPVVVDVGRGANWAQAHD